MWERKTITVHNDKAVRLLLYIGGLGNGFDYCGMAGVSMLEPLLPGGNLAKPMLSGWGGGGGGGCVFPCCRVNKHCVRPVVVLMLFGHCGGPQLPTHAISFSFALCVGRCGCGCSHTLYRIRLNSLLNGCWDGDIWL